MYSQFVMVKYLWIRVYIFGYVCNLTSMFGKTRSIFFKVTITE